MTMVGWEIFPWVAATSITLTLTGAVVALCNKQRSRIAMLCAIMGIAIYALFIVALWIGLERPPMRTMGETRLWYSMFMLVAGLFTYLRWHYRWILPFTTLMATVFMTINILRPEIHDQTLMPALQSPWFVPHVSVYMFSYAILGCATLLAIGALATRNDNLNRAIVQLLYIGTACVTLGMLSGALWAKEAWGAYWSWDPKEAWAAVTWGLYLVAIHLALRPSTLLNKASRVAYYTIIIVAFLSLQMCWWGVNYLPSAAASEHTYNQ